VVTLSVTDNNGNTATAELTVNVTGTIPAPSITVSRTDHTNTGGSTNTIYIGYGAQQLTLTAANPGDNATEWSWSPVAGLSNATAANPVFTPAQTGVYTFDVTGTNESGCTAAASMTITVIDVRCGNNNDKVLLCHKGKPTCISASDVQDHLGHGCPLGSCAVRGQAAGNMLVTEADQPFSVYPNPASGNCTITFETGKNGVYRLELFSTQGQRMRVLESGTTGETVVKKHQLTTASMTTGIYFLKLVTDRGTSVTRLVVQR
jgi:PKD repeat protein